MDIQVKVIKKNVHAYSYSQRITVSVLQLIIMLPVHTVSSCHNPASLNQGSSACVVVVAARSVLKRDLRGGGGVKTLVSVIHESKAAAVYW